MSDAKSDFESKIHITRDFCIVTGLKLSFGSHILELNDFNLEKSIIFFKELAANGDIPLDGYDVIDLTNDH